MLLDFSLFWWLNLTGYFKLLTSQLYTNMTSYVTYLSILLKNLSGYPIKVYKSHIYTPRNDPNSRSITPAPLINRARLSMAMKNWIKADRRTKSVIISFKDSKDWWLKPSAAQFSIAFLTSMSSNNGKTNFSGSFTWNFWDTAAATACQENWTPNEANVSGYQCKVNWHKPP